MTETKKSGPGDRKTHLVCLAAEQFLKHGYAGTSMNDIAVAAGIRKAALYHHFPSKAALFIAATTAELGGGAAELRVLLEDDSLDHETRFRRAMEIIYRGCVRSAAGRMAPVIAETSRIVPEVARGFHDGFMDAMKQVMTDIVSAGVRDGAFRELDTIGFHHLVFGPPVKLAMSRAMFQGIEAAQPDLDIDHALATHTEMMLLLLRRPDTPADGT